MRLVITAGAYESYHASMAFLSEWMSEEQLNRLDDQLWDTIELLPSRPRMGPYEVMLHHPDHRYRKAIIRNFKVIYWIDGRTIVVTDIFYAKQDPKRMKG